MADQLHIDHGHALYRDFKHRRLVADLCLVWRPGAGGHFINAALGACTHKLSDVNEYLSHDPMFADFEPSYLPIDEHTLAWRLDHDQCYNAVQNDRTFASSDTCITPVLASHLPPMMLCKVYSCDIDEMIFIEVSYDDLWIPRLLWFKKVMLNCNYQQKPHLMADFAAEVDRFPVPWPAHTALVNLLRANGLTLPISNTILIWKYLTYCFKQQLDHMDMDRFMSFARACLLTKLQVGTYWEHRLLTSEYYQDAKTFCTAQSRKHCIVDYRQLFFAHDVPSDSALSVLDRSTIREYSRGNLEILLDIQQLMGQDDPVLQDISHKIDELAAVIGSEDIKRGS